MATQYISYDRFVNEIRYEREAEKRIRYLGKEYKFWYEGGRYCFQQYLPKKLEVQRYEMYEKMLEEVKIEGKSIKELWDTNGFEYIYRIRNVFGVSREYSYYVKLWYKQMKDLYNTTMKKANINRIILGEDKTEQNIQADLFAWAIYIEFLIFGFFVFLAMFCGFQMMGSGIFLPYMFVSGITYIAIIPMTFYIYLINSGPKKLKYVFAKEWVTWIFILLCHIFINWKLLWLSIIIDALGVLTGYVMYKSYYNQKLKEAEKIREEYRKKQEGNLYN